MKYSSIGKFFSLASALIASIALPCSAKDTKTSPAAEKAVQAKTDFIRVHQQGENVYLQTGITTFTKGDVSVDLIGAVHIADKSYYDQLNQEFTNYEPLLFEMVGGERIKEMLQAEAEKPARKKDRQMDFISGMHATMSKKLALTGQKDGIDYSKDNFVHADLTIDEFNALQKKKGESLLKFALQNAIESARNGNKANGPKPPSTIKLLKALIKGDSNALKLAIVDTLGTGDDQISAMMGKNSVIIGDRNAKCLAVMDNQIAIGKKHIGIFYGAAHFPDMEERMLKMGYKQTKHRWLNAWTLKK